MPEEAARSGGLPEASRRGVASIDSAAMAEPPAEWMEELSELLRIPSVSADPAHSGDVVARGRVGPRLHPAAGGEAELQTTEKHPARDRRDPRVAGRRRRADGDRLRALRRPAAGAARGLGEPAVRADRARRLALRARRRRRQGPALPPAEGGRAARRRRRAAGERALHLRRRGGVRRPLDRRLPRGGRARGRRVRHLRRAHARAGRPDLRDRDARPCVLPRPRPDRRARPALRASTAARR